MALPASFLCNSPPVRHDVLGDRYILYGEWLYAKHTVFYNSLPHYFLEYDLLDRFPGQFLSIRCGETIVWDREHRIDL